MELFLEREQVSDVSSAARSPSTLRKQQLLLQQQQRKMARGRRVDDLNYRRSFFVRMVSDPKIYNPKIVEKSLTDATIDEVVQSPQESADSANEGRRSSLQ